ncbi:DUF1033 family protein [Priestia abyssalis]|uniref:DUF1033 family protein n=1 Tax=Priestia abyssalis TaxID=1221450 RepID=UPI0009958546|nr:DUF1033 family protein [Priestia abyssalis]
MNEQWSVCKTKGDCEPWLFLDGWQEEITERLSFHDQDEALRTYAQWIKEYKRSFESVKETNLSLFSFWNEGEMHYCEACDDDLQLFYGIVFMKGGEVYRLAEDEQAAKYLLNFLNDR